MSTDTGRKVDIVIWGATGFTGQLVAEYFARNVKREVVKWGIAGRNWEKLESLKSSLEQLDSSLNDLDIFLGDTNDQASVDRVVGSAKVVINTAGPFLKHGTPVVDACVRLGAHYCDITGESVWIKELIDKYHQEAENKGVYIVNSCGFDSIPSDLGSFMIADYMQKNLSRKCAKVTFYLESMKGEASGGTLASIMDLFDSNKHIRMMTDPFLLNPPGVKGIPNDQNFIRYSKEAAHWTVPFIMAAANTKIVRRSHALALIRLGGNSPFTNDFKYGECMEVRNIIVAIVVTAIMAVVMVGLYFRIGRWVFSKFTPKPGQGPSKKARDSGFFKVKLIGWSQPEGDEKPTKVVGYVIGAKDPGYGETAKMLSESALCLLHNMDQLAEKGGARMRGGVITPSAAMGSLLVNRLRDAGMLFTVEKE